MRVMVLVKASKESEAGRLPDAKMLADMGKFNDELVKSGVMLAGEGLHLTSKGKRVRFSGRQRTVVDGPFAARAGLRHDRPIAAGGGAPRRGPDGGERLGRLEDGFG
jgi:hypothetical protein